MSVKVEHIVRVTAERTGTTPGDPIVHEYTVTDLVTGAYRWGRCDGVRAAQGLPLFGDGEVWTTGSVSLAELRSTYVRDTEGGVHEVVRRDG